MKNKYENLAGIEWKGPIFDIDELNQEYESARFFVYPSLAEKGETFGLAPLEAMAWGCVPIVSDLECFKDFIRDHFSGFVFNHRDDAPSRLAKLLGELMALPVEQLSDVSSEALKVRSSHSISYISDQFLDLFDRLISSKRKDRTN